MTHARPYSDLDVSSNAFWSRPAAEREQTFAQLRRREPVSWQRPTEGGLMPTEDEDGYWAVTRYADIQAVSAAPEVFCSGQGVQIENIPDLFLEATQSFIAMDAPRHTLLRRLVSAAFTPRRVATIEEQIADQARRIVDGVLEAGSGDFVDLVAARLPRWTIYEMVGLPDDQRAAVAHAADTLVSYNDAEIQDGRDALDVVAESIVVLVEAGLELAGSRRRTPGDDLMTNLVQAEVDGQRLTDDEISAFFVLLSVAGNDTTRNTIAHSMKALCDHPDQRAWLAADPEARMGSAVEEFVRWSTPVLTFKRTATRAAEVNGTAVAAGEKVVMFYSSGNRDETVFADPMRFDLTRSPNRHLAFGGGGPHYCMGQMLAKTQLRAVFGQLVQRVPGLEVGEPSLLLSNFVHGVKSMPFTLA